MHYNIKEYSSVINGLTYHYFRMTTTEKGKSKRRTWGFNEKNKDEVRAKVEALRKELIDKDEDLIKLHERKGEFRMQWGRT